MEITNSIVIKWVDINMCSWKDAMEEENSREDLGFKEIEEMLVGTHDIKYGLSVNYYNFSEECKN